MNTLASHNVALDVGPVQRWNAALAGGVCATAWFLATPGFVGSVALGAVLEAMNFRSLRRNGEMVFGQAVSGSALVVAGFGLRFSLLLAAITGSLYAGAHPVGLVIGLSLIVPSSLISAWIARPRDTDATPLDPEEANWDEWNPWFARENTSDDDEDAQ